MDDKLQILTIRLASRKAPTTRRSVVLAEFDISIAGIVRLNHLHLIRTEHGGFSLIAPGARGHGDRSYSITDDSLRGDIVEAVRAAYRLLGGSGAEWIRKEDWDRLPLPAEAAA